MRAAAKTPFYATALFWVIVSPVAAAALIVGVVVATARTQPADPKRPADRPLVTLPEFVDPYPEGSKVLAASKWWTKGATPEQLQKLVNELTGRKRELYFNSRGEFTDAARYRSWLWTVGTDGGPSGLSTLEYHKRNNGINTHFQRLLLYRQTNGKEMTNPLVVDSGIELELRKVEQENLYSKKEDATAVIIKALAEDTVEGSGKGLKLKLGGSE